MYKRVWFLLLLLLSAGACRKTARDVAPAKNVNIIRFPLADVKNWLAGQQPLAGAEMQSFHQTLHYDLQKAEAALNEAQHRKLMASLPRDENELGSLKLIGIHCNQETTPNKKIELFCAVYKSIKELNI